MFQEFRISMLRGKTFDPLFQFDLILHLELSRAQLTVSTISRVIRFASLHSLFPYLSVKPLNEPEGHILSDHG